MYCGPAGSYPSCSMLPRLFLKWPPLLMHHYKPACPWVRAIERERERERERESLLSVKSVIVVV